MKNISEKMGAYSWRHRPVSRTEMRASLTAGGYITSGAMKEIVG
jgi:hypothetical protein